MQLPIETDQLKIVHYPDARLRKKTLPVQEFDERLRGVIRRMFEVMREERGVGLAAPQVGLSVRLFVMNPTGEPRDALALVNPRLTELDGAEEAEEGCLSLPGVSVTVRRATRARLSAQDEHGRPIELEGEGLAARIWQHEIDHLDGVLIIDRMGPGDELATRKALRALEEAAPRSALSQRAPRGKTRNR